MPVRLDVTSGDETYTLMRGQPQQVKPGDISSRMAKGIMSNIIYGPDQRTQIQPPRAMCLHHLCPAGIAQDSLTRHLQISKAMYAMFSPQAITELLQVFG